MYEKSLPGFIHIIKGGRERFVVRQSILGFIVWLIVGLVAKISLQIPITFVEGSLFILAATMFSYFRSTWEWRKLMRNANELGITSDMAQSMPESTLEE